MHFSAPITAAMRDAANFEEFYSTRIEPLVKEYEERRAKSVSWGNLLVFFIALFFISVLTAVYADLEGAGLFFFISLACLSFSIYKYAVVKDAFVSGFKTSIIQQIINFIIPENEYRPDRYMSSKLFKASGLYRERLDLSGDDLVKGTYKNVPFKAGELVTVIPDDDNKWPTFKGIFFAADIGRFAGATYIWRKDNIQLGNSVADEHYRLYPIPKVYKIRTGSEVFEKYYTVYSSWPDEAHSILTEEMMQNILAFRHQLKREISLSFVAGRCYVAIPFEQQLLEPAQDITDKETIKEYFFTILLYPAIINQLKLYEYI